MAFYPLTRGAEWSRHKAPPTMLRYGSGRVSGRCWSPYPWKNSDHSLKLASFDVDPLMKLGSLIMLKLLDRRKLGIVRGLAAHEAEPLLSQHRVHGVGFRDQDGVLRLNKTTW
jgi:hypothetical protein